MQMQVGNGIETGTCRSDCNVGMEKPSSNQAISGGFSYNNPRISLPRIFRSLWVGVQEMQAGGWS